MTVIQSRGMLKFSEARISVLKIERKAWCMSTHERLKRLGLQHLENDPEELRKALDKLSEEYEKEKEKNRKRLMKKYNLTKI
jgi:hypothetical protein